MNHRLISFAAKQFVWLIILAAAIFSAGTADAVPPPLTPGTTEYNPGLSPPFSFFTPSFVSGPLATAPVAKPYNIPVIFHDFPYNYNGTINGAFAGFVSSSVWANADGQLAFEYVFNNVTPPTPPNPPLTDIVRATINDPSEPWYNSIALPGFPPVGPITIFAAGSDPSSGGHSTPVNGFFGGWNNGVPFDVTRSATDYGVAVEFNPLNSGTQLNSTPNDQSVFIWFATDATDYNVTNVGLSDNGHVGTSQAFAPGIHIFPEPSALVLAMIGCFVGGFAIRRGRTMGRR